tara:strand:+ start:793 stop:1230 length:438 start_codon:yes stop_codon:yes gene_type:complete
MVVETRYDYIYYTVLDVETAANVLQEADTIEEILAASNATERENIWIKSLNKLFRESNDFTVNNFRVDSAQYCDDIEHWRHRNIQHKECPVFVKYNESQPVKNEGEGHMFYLYEEEEEEEVEYYSPPPDGDIDGLAGLAGYGGRL